jgi:O-antigen ligase
MGFLYFGAGVVAAIWAAACARRGALLWAVLVFLLLNSAFGVYFWQRNVGPLPLTLDRVALVAVVALFVMGWCVGTNDPKPLGAADWLLAAFLAVLVTSTFTHSWNTAPPETVVPVWRLITGYLAPAVIYWVGRQMRFGQRQSNQLLAALTFFGVYLAVTAILEIAGQWSLVFPRNIAEPTLGFHFGRARGPMLHAVAFGFYLGVCLMAACLWLPRQGRWGWATLCALAPLFLVAGYLSYTRSVWIGLALGITVLLTATLPRSWRTLALTLGVVACLFGGTLFWDKFLAFQREYSAAGTRESAELRKIFVHVSWQMFLDHPLLGCGFGQFYVEKFPYLSDRSTELQLEAIRPLIHHNMPLGLLTETGLLGLGLFLAVLAAWTIHAWRLWRDADAAEWTRWHSLFFLGVLGVYLPQALFHEVSYLNMVHTLLFFLAGVSTGLYQTALVASRRTAPLGEPGCRKAAAANQEFGGPSARAIRECAP